LFNPPTRLIWKDLSFTLAKPAHSETGGWGLQVPKRYLLLPVTGIESLKVIAFDNFYVKIILTAAII
jgi:hypothetical protein